MIYDYYQIIIEVAQLRQHKQRLNDLRTQLRTSADGIHTISITNYY